MLAQNCYYPTPFKLRSPLSPAHLIPLPSLYPHLYFFCTCLPVSCLFQSNCLEPLSPWFVTREKFNTVGVQFWWHQGPKLHTMSALLVSVVCAQMKKIEGLFIQTRQQKPAAVQNMGKSVRSEWPGQIFSHCPET